jgi:hypothetical protein
VSEARGEGRRFALVLGAIVAFFALLGSGLWLRGRTVAGRDRLAAEIAADVADEMKALESDDPIPPAGEDAAVLYEEAFAAHREDGWILLNKVQGEWDRPPADLVEYLAANAAALALLDKAVRLDRCRFPTAYNLSGPGDPSPVPTGPPAQAAGMLRFLSLVHARGRVALSEGRIRDAAADAVRIPGLVRHYVARNLAPLDYLHQALACEFPERLLQSPLLDAPTARALARDLPDARRVWDGAPLHERFDALHREGRLALLIRKDVSGSYREQLRKELGLPPAGLFGFTGAEDIARCEEERARLAGIRERAKRGETTSKPPTWIAMLSVTRVAFAIRAFQLERGATPARLADLVPDFIPDLPPDPLADAPLQYEVRPDGWSVWGSGKRNVQKARGEWSLENLRIDFPPRKAPR